MLSRSKFTRLMLMLCLTAAPCFAQVSTATITGVVQDSAGALGPWGSGGRDTNADQQHSESRHVRECCLLRSCATRGAILDELYRRRFRELCPYQYRSHRRTGG